MKKCHILSVIVFCLTACSHNGEVNDKINLAGNNIIIDVRTKAEYDEGHLKKSLNIPYNEIKEKIDGITTDKGDTIIVYCRSGRRSGIAKKALEEVGYKNVINAGAYKELKKLEEQQMQK
jgi:phage shock protein E